MEFANGVRVCTTVWVLQLPDASTTPTRLAQLCSFAEEHRFTMECTSRSSLRDQRPGTIIQCFFSEPNAGLP